MSIATTLFTLRKNADESLQQVADGVGVSKAHIWELEKGRSANPSFELMQKLAAHFGVSTDVLTGTADTPAPEDQQIERIHRDLKELSDRDRAIIEQMVASMKTSS